VLALPLFPTLLEASPTKLYIASVIVNPENPEACGHQNTKGLCAFGVFSFQTL
jgi:hypothetical protein